MDRRLKISTVGALLAALTGSTLAMTPAFALEPKPVYVESKNAAATVSQILASGDTVAGSALWQGIPDGMGGVKNSDGTVSVFVNHELAASDPFVGKLERPYGGYGATISKVTTNSDGTQVTKIEPAINKVSYFDYQAGIHSDTPEPPNGSPDLDSNGTPNHSTALNRFCSATLIARSGLSTKTSEYVSKVFTVKRKVNVRYVIEIDGRDQVIIGKRVKKVKQTFYQKSNGKWTTTKVKRNVLYGVNDPIFLTGEEGSDESRVFGLNTRTGELVQLPNLGLGATENISVAAGTGKTTVAMIGEDGLVTDSQLFMYKGTKRSEGTWYERAGLANGQQHVASISSLLNAKTGFAGVTDVVAAGSAIKNDVMARAAMDRKVISSAVRRGAVTSTKFAISAAGVATVTADNTFKAGDVVSIAGLSANALIGIDDPTEVTILSAQDTKYTFATDGEEEASADNTSIVATPSTNSVLVTTTTRHNLVEGDTVSIKLTEGLSGTYVVTGVPLVTDPGDATKTISSLTKFTIDTVGTSPSTFAPTASSTVNRLLDVEFKEINTRQSGAAQAASAKTLGTEFSRIEDATFNPKNPNEFFFVTTQSDSYVTAVDAVDKVTSVGWTAQATSDGATVNSPVVKEGSGSTSRDGGAVWKLTYVDVRKPELGATLDLVLNGSEAPLNDADIKLNKPDNITISDDGEYAFLQEDPGANDHVARLLAIRLSDSALVSVAAFKSNMFGVSSPFTADNADGYMTNDEETSGIFDATKLFGGTGSTFVFNAQVHPVTTLGGLNSSSDGLSFASDPLKATATALLRPDLRTMAVSLTVTGVSVAGEATSGSPTVYNRDMTLTVDNSDGKVAANDIINVSGLTRAHNGTYVVKSVTTTSVVVSLYSGKTASISAAKYNSPTLVGAAPKLWVSDQVEDLAIKDAINEGGALYTLKIADLADLFAIG